jgi:uncharacterized protein YciW
MAKPTRFDIVLVDELGGYIDFTQREVDVLRALVKLSVAVVAPLNA